MAPWSYELSYKMAPLLRAPAVMLDTWLTRRKLEARHQGVPARRGRVGVPARVARARPHAAQEAAARARCSPTSPTSRSTRCGCTAGIDRHLAVSEISAEAADARAAARTPARAGRWSATASATPTYDRDAVRSNLGLAPDDRAVLVVAGSWGVGDVVATVEAIGRSGEFHPITVCGRDDNLRAELEQRRLRHRHRLDRRDARAHDRGRRAGRERRWAHVHGGVRGRAAGHHVQARSPGTARTTPR